MSREVNRIIRKAEAFETYRAKDRVPDVGSGWVGYLRGRLAGSWLSRMLAWVRS